MLAFNRREVITNVVLAAIVFGGLGLLVLINPRIAREWVFLCVLGAAAFVVFRSRRFIRRGRLSPLPPPGVVAVIERMPWYRRLSAPERALFLQHVSWFLAEQRVTGVGTPIDDELRANVAAGACMLSFGLPHYEWSTDREILIYADSFNDSEWRARDDGELEGQFHPQGPILFSARELRRCFEDEDGMNVAIHEFAHLMDFVGGGDTDGAPEDLDPVALQQWRKEMTRHLDSIGNNRRLFRLLENYAYSNEAEFFAAMTEVFFEIPDVLSEIAPDLYLLMSRLLRQDPLVRIAPDDRTTYRQIMGLPERPGRDQPDQRVRSTGRMRVVSASRTGPQPVVEASRGPESQPGLPGIDQRQADGAHAAVDAAAAADDSADEPKAPQMVETTTGGQLFIPGLK